MTNFIHLQCAKVRRLPSCLTPIKRFVHSLIRFFVCFVHSLTPPYLPQKLVVGRHLLALVSTWIYRVLNFGVP